MPLYEMASIRRDIEGEKSYHRKRYEVHRVLLEVFGSNPLYGAPDYDKLISMVNEICELPIASEGKPRSFLQKVGTEICRAEDDNCWVNWMDRKIESDYRAFVQDWRKEIADDPDKQDEVPPTWGSIISDCRFVNEAEFIYNHPNGILVKLTATPEERARRIHERDGKEMTAEQLSHASEKQVSLIPEEWFAEVVDTTGMSIEDQVTYIRKLVESRIER